MEAYGWPIISNVVASPLVATLRASVIAPDAFSPVNDRLGGAPGIGGSIAHHQVANGTSGIQVSRSTSEPALGMAIMPRFGTRFGQGNAFFVCAP